MNIKKLFFTVLTVFLFTQINVVLAAVAIPGCCYINNQPGTPSSCYDSSDFRCPSGGGYLPHSSCQTNQITRLPQCISNDYIGSTVPTKPQTLSSPLSNAKKAPLLRSINSEVTVELDMPDYLPEYLRHPQHFVSGRTIKVIVPEALPEYQSFFIEEATGEKSNFRKPKRVELKPNGKTFIFEIPPKTKTGNHIFSYVSKGQKKSFKLMIHGLDENKNSLPLAPLLNKLNLSPHRALAATTPDYTITQTKISNCYWEMSLAGSPNSNNLYHACAYSGYEGFSRSTNGGSTWLTDSINTITTYPRNNIYYNGDQKIVVVNNNLFYLSSLFRNNGKYGGMLYQGGPTGNLTATIFQDINADDLTTNSFADFPKLAVNLPEMYISAGGVKSSTTNFFKGIFNSSDLGVTFKLNPTGYNYSPITSIMVADNGIVYAAQINGLLRFNSFNPFSKDLLATPFIYNIASPKISTISNRAWNAYQGPELIIDKSGGAHNGRFYLLWSKAQSKILDTNFEYGQYGYNFDIFVSHSDDSGVTWSTPVKVNDDNGFGDQLFPSANIDSNGTLHVAWLDHRDHQDQAVFDVYYANSPDGITFSPNVKVNATAVPNAIGGRSVGDYLDMVVGYPEKTYIGFPCASESGLDDANQACLATLTPQTGEISNITINPILDTSGQINWSTNKPTNSQVEYGLTTNYGQSTSIDSTLTKSHSLGIYGLAPATFYHFRVKSADKDGSLAVSQDQTFTTIADPNLIFYWKFDDANPSTPPAHSADASGHNMFGNIKSGVGSTTDHAPLPNISNPSSFSFSGVKSAVENYLNNAIPVSGDFTASLWFKGNKPKNNKILMQITGSTYSKPKVKIVMTSAGKISLLSGASSKTITSANNSGNNQWHFVAVKRNTKEIPANRYAFFLDGVLIGTSAEVKSISPFVFIEVGHSGNSNDGNFYFIGNIDDVRLYNRPLKNDEIFELYIGTKG